MKVSRIKSGLVALFCLCTALCVRGQQPTEYQVKAAFIYNFLQFVEWPTNGVLKADSPIVVGIIGQDPFGGDIDQLLGNKQVNGHPIRVKRIQNVGEIDKCQVVFVSRSERNHLAKILAEAGAHRVFSISDLDGFAARGGTVEFFRENNKLRFAINLGTVKRSQFQVSSKLLRLAKIVDKEGD